ncbi:carbonic anhydrase [Colwelliaceae bacterium BS250]
MKLKLAHLILVGMPFTAMAGDGHWEYTGENGVDHWGEISSKYALCSSGVNQSPINIVTGSVIEADLPPLIINYQVSDIEEVNNGHTIQANIKGNNTFTNDSGTFNLLQFHFHSPSENTIDGKSFPLEAHLVHADQDGRLAVIGVMFRVGKSNPQLAQMWEDMPTANHTNKDLVKALSTVKLLPEKKSYYRFNGSLTTPPCTEGVRWFVLKDTIEASQAQIDKFHQVMGTDTNRPTQPINARVILQ